MTELIARYDESGLTFFDKVTGLDVLSIGRDGTVNVVQSGKFQIAGQVPASSATISTATPQATAAAGVAGTSGDISDASHVHPLGAHDHKATSGHGGQIAYTDLTGTPTIPADVSAAHFITTQAESALSAEVLLSAVIGRGVASSRPSAGTAGRLYYSTDTLILERDNGASWDLVSIDLAGATVTIGKASGGIVKLQSIPTSDPHAAGQVYSLNGVLMISNG